MHRVIKVALILAAVVLSLGCISVAVFVIVDELSLVPEHTLLNVKLDREDLDKPVGFQVTSIPNLEVLIIVEFKDGEWKPWHEGPKTAQVRVDILRDGRIVANESKTQRDYDLNDEEKARRMKDESVGLSLKPSSPGDYTVQIHDKDNCYKEFAISARYRN